MADGSGKSHYSNGGHTSTSGSNLSVTALEFVPQQSPSPALFDPRAHTSELFDFLFSFPQDLPEITSQLQAFLSNYLTNQQSLETLVDHFLLKFIERDYVQFIAVKCCVTLVENLKSGENYTFRDVLLRRSRVMHVDFLNHSEPSESLYNFTLLIAEMALSIKTGNGSYMIPLFAATIELLNKLLDFSSDASIRCLLNVLKFSGKILDAEMKDDFSKLFERIKRKLVSDAGSETSRSCLLDIIIRKSSNWNQLDESIPPVSSQLLQPVFPVTNVADQFNVLNLNGDSPIQIHYGDTVVYGEDSRPYFIPNEDAEPEIYEDYEKFVAETESVMDASVENDYDKFLAECESKK